MDTANTQLAITSPNLPISLSASLFWHRMQKENVLYLKVNQAEMEVCRAKRDYFKPHKWRMRGNSAIGFYLLAEADDEKSIMRICEKEFRSWVNEKQRYALT